MSTIRHTKGNARVKNKRLFKSAAPENPSRRYQRHANTGSKLIWMDALYIVQDDRRDWQHECSNVATIYNNASVTIAASAAKHKASGIFVKRPECLMEPIEIPSRCSNGTDKGSMFAVQRSGLRGEGANLLDRSVLGTRAWCLQEQPLHEGLSTLARTNSSGNVKCRH